MKKSIVLIFGLCIICGCVDITPAKTQVPESTSAAVLKATLISPPDVVAGQPVLLTLKLTNVSSLPINLPWPKFIDQFITSTVTSSDGTVSEITHPGGSLGHGKYPGGDVRIGAVISVLLSHTFHSQGRFQVKCTLDTSPLHGHNIWDVWEGRAESNTITIMVGKKGG